MPEEIKGTAQPGSDPGKDTAKAGAEPAKDKEGASVAQPPGGDKDLPFDKHPKWQSARKAEKQFNELLEANDCDSVEDLLEVIEAGNLVRVRGISKDKLDEIVKKATTLDQYETYWKQQEELNKRGQEDPQDTIRRLEHELNARNMTVKEREAREKADVEAKQTADAYDNEVTKLIGAAETLPENEREFVIKFFGVDNPANEIDIRNRKEIKRVVSEGLKWLEDYKQTVIQNYLAGKSGIPKIPSSQIPGSETPPKIKNLEDARNRLAEQARKVFQHGG